MRKGSKMSPETIAKIKESKKNISNETRQKMSAARKGRKPWNKGLTKDDPRVAKNTRGGWKHKESTKKLMSKKKLGRSPWNKGLSKATDYRVKKYSNKLTGIPKSEETKKLISQSKKGTVPYNKGLTKETSEIVKQYSEKSSKTIRKQYEEGRKPWNKGLTKDDDDRISTNGGPLGQKLGPRSKEVKEKIRIGNTGKIINENTRQKLRINKLEYYKTHENHWKGKELPYSVWNKGETKETHPSMRLISESRMNYIQNNPGTFISNREDVFDEWFTELGLLRDKDYFRQYNIKDIDDPFLADFYFPSIRLVVEFDGKYWHWIKNNHYELDMRRNDQLRSKGYVVLRFIESGDYRQNKSEERFAKEQLLNILKPVLRAYGTTQH